MDKSSRGGQDATNPALRTARIARQGVEKLGRGFACYRVMPARHDIHQWLEREGPQVKLWMRQNKRRAQASASRRALARGLRAREMQERTGFDSRPVCHEARVIQNIDVERTRPPTLFTSASGAALETLERAQEGLRRQGGVSHDHGVSEIGLSAYAERFALIDR